MSVILILLFSKNLYTASLSSYYTFYLIEKFHVTVQSAQLHLFVFLGAVGNGTTQMGYSRAVSTWFVKRRGLALAWSVVMAKAGGRLIDPRAAAEGGRAAIPHSPIGSRGAMDALV